MQTLLSKIAKPLAALAILASVFAATPVYAELGQTPTTYDAAGTSGASPASQGWGTQTGATVTTNANGSYTVNTGVGTDLECSATSGKGLAICVSGFVYYITVGLGSWIAGITAYVFDYAVQLSLVSSAYAFDFITVGWSIVRDVANMSFLFILVYIAFKIMFQAETAGTMRLLVWVVTIALLVNFSFLMTRVVIDAGNIVALQFYNAIAAGSPTIAQSSASGGGVITGGDTKDLSSTIMNALNPQAIIGTNGFNNFVNNQNPSAMYYLIVSTIVFLMTGVSLFMLAAVFIFAALRFIMRIIGLWFVIIAAPVAFVAAITSQKGMGKWFNTWFGYLLQFTFYPAVFLFMFYIEVRFLQEMNTTALFNNIYNATSSSQSWTTIAQASASVSIRLGFIIATMYLILRSSQWMGSAFKDVGTKWAERGLFSLGRGTLRGAIGTTAFIGRNSLGTTGRIRGNAFLANGTYDIRNAPLVRTLVGSSLGKGTPASRAYGLATRDTPEGRKAAAEAQAKKAAAKEADEKKRKEQEAAAAGTTGATTAGAANAGATTGTAGAATATAAAAGASRVGGAQANRATNAPGTTTNANPNQPFRQRLQTGPGFAPENLNNLGKILEAVKKQNAEKGQPIFNKAVAPVINQQFKTKVSQVMAEPIFNTSNQPALNTKDQWGGAPAAAARATATAATVAATTPDMSHSASVAPRIDESRADVAALNEGIKGLGGVVREVLASVKSGSTPPKLIINVPEHSGPTTQSHVAAGSAHLSDEDVKKVVKGVEHVIESNTHSEPTPPRGPAAPTGARPAPKVSTDVIGTEDDEGKISA